MRAAKSRVTVVVVARESFAHAVRSLGSLYRHAGVPFELIYMDGGMPPAIRFAVRREATRRGFKLVSAGP